MQKTTSKKIFFISDIHGHFIEMISALDEAGYNYYDENHLLVVLGDIFDRGSENIYVYEYLKKLSDEGKAIVTYGNHHKFFIDFLEGSYDPFNYLYNGLDETIADFWHRTKPFETWSMLDNNIDEPTYGDYAKWVDKCRKDIMKEYPELLPWLKSRPRYFESKNIIGTHASLDLKSPNWKEPHVSYYTYTDWDALDFDDGNFILEKNNTGKKIVVGHFDSGHLRDKHNLGAYTDHSVLKTDDDKYFIDGCVMLTKKVNVLVLEDELLD